MAAGLALGLGLALALAPIVVGVPAASGHSAVIGTEPADGAVLEAAPAKRGSAGGQVGAGQARAQEASRVPERSAGGAPGAPATYVGMCHVFCDSVESFQAGFGPHMKEIMGDIANYTDLTPVMQISEVVVGH